MLTLAAFLTGLVAALHLYFLVLEMFLWQAPIGLRIFGMTPENAAKTAILAKNQGLYNGFLAAGLIGSFFVIDPAFQETIRLFFLGCITLAGIFGALTAKPSIFFVQALPAMIAAVVVLLT